MEADERDDTSMADDDRGPVSIAGERGPDRREEILGVSMFQLKGSTSLTGVVIWATPGSFGKC